MSDHADTIRREAGADLPDTAHLLISVLEYGGTKELLGADLHGRAHESLRTLVAERQQAIDERDAAQHRAAENEHRYVTEHDRGDGLRQAFDALRVEKQQLEARCEQRVPLFGARSGRILQGPVVLRKAIVQRQQAIDALREAFVAGALWAVPSAHRSDVEGHAKAWADAALLNLGETE